MIKIGNNQKGFVVSIITFFVLVIMLSVAVAMAALVVYRQKQATNEVASLQSYYASESGEEDALLRLKDNPQISSLNYTLTVGAASTNVSIPAEVGGSRAIDSSGNDNGRMRNVEVVYSSDSQGASFHYGAQVGAGGLVMNNGSQVQGNVFSDGNITGSGIITNDAIVAGHGNYLQSVHVEGNAQAYSCTSGKVDGNLTYVTGGSNSCTVKGAVQTQADDIASEALPLTQDQINSFKSDAVAGTVINGNYSVVNGQSITLGPAEIIGSLTVANNATLTLSGTVYVTGNITVSNNAAVKLSSSYGSLGGVLIADGTIIPSNNSTFSGSGQQGSYVLVLSTSSADPAITIANNATGAIFYTSAGGINVSNNARVKELTGYKVTLSNNAIVQYDSGLQDVSFSSGPSGGWKVESWQEK